MPWPEAANTDLSRLVAAAADLCRKPLRHGVVLVAAPGEGADAERLPDPDGDPDRLEGSLADAGPAGEGDDLCLRLEARDAGGTRLPDEDLELEIYRSAGDLHLTLAWLADDSRPMLWQGQHPVWMDPQGRRCDRPADGMPLEALARRLRALLAGTA